jgi:hypothetical protein
MNWWRKNKFSWKYSLVTQLLSSKVLLTAMTETLGQTAANARPIGDWPSRSGCRAGSGVRPPSLSSGFDGKSSTGPAFDILDQSRPLAKGCRGACRHRQVTDVVTAHTLQSCMARRVLPRRARPFDVVAFRIVGPDEGGHTRDARGPLRMWGGYDQPRRLRCLLRRLNHQRRGGEDGTTMLL